MTRNLTAGFVRKVSEAGKYYDTNGLFLRVRKGGSKQWIQRISVHGRAVEMGLGGWPLVSLEEARDEAFENRRTARRGSDPLALKRDMRTPTFADALDKVIAMHKGAWRDPKTESLWRSTMEVYAMPRLGRMPVDTISTGDVLAILIPIWNTKRATAKKVRNRIAAVMKWAVAEGHRQDNPAGEAIGAALPKNGVIHVAHHRALPHAEVADAIATVRATGAASAAKLAFEFLVLTACRSGEVRLARWDEIDADAATWTIPAARMKTGREHVVPLSDRALAVLAEAREMADGSGLVFPATRYGRPMSDSSLSKLLRENGIAAVPHGFRSSFRDWCGEATNAPREVAEACLAHTTANAVEAAYARSDLIGKRRALTQQWADYLAGGRGTVIAIGEARRA